MPDEEIQPEATQGQRQETAEDEAIEVPSLETLQAELEEAQRERSQFKALAQRAQADLVNLRRRVEEEREGTYRAIAARFITKLLPSLDDIQRALAQPPATAEEAAWLDGIRLVERSLRALLESEGVTVIEAEGKPFDPREHEALFSVENEDREAGTVVSVIRQGYALHGKVLRAAQVAVARRQETETQKPPHQGEAHNPEEMEE